ncbi:MAG: hypothetical protein IPK72_25050 [Candidatus Eisenbacteria bacterium]|nr:hypothetical protein [Candidatus Eisenbacteria bacterium]
MRRIRSDLIVAAGMAVATAAFHLAPARAESTPPSPSPELRVAGGTVRGAARWKSRLRGLWAQKGYVDTIRSTQSPFAASSLLLGISDFRYDSITDFLIVGINHHEQLVGSAELLAEESLRLSAAQPTGQGKWRALIEGYAIEFEQTGVDTVLECRGLNGSWPMLKVEASPDRTLQDWVHAELFGGRFVILDAAEQTVARDVRVYAEGSIEEFPPFESYQVWTDYNDDVPRMDTVVFRDADGAESWYAWSWKPETIELYELTGGDPTSGHLPNAGSERGPLRYVLVRLTNPRGRMGE